MKSLWSKREISNQKDLQMMDEVGLKTCNTALRSEFLLKLKRRKSDTRGRIISAV